MAAFKNPALKQLTDQQVRYAPPAKRLEQLGQARKLLGEIEASRPYPYQYVCFRVTGFRSDSYPALLVPGEDLCHDLALMIEALGAALPEEPGEPLLSLEEVAGRLHVSTKTIRRWRKLGLVGRWVCRGGKRQLGFLSSVVEQFSAQNRETVEKGGRFSQLTAKEREDILRQARRLARAEGIKLTEVSRRIAHELGRSTEAIRYTIRNHDKEHPQQAVFPDRTGPLDAAAKMTIHNSYREGMSVEALAKKYGRTKTSVYRVLNEVRAQRLLEQPLDYIDHPDFADAAKAASVLAPMPDAEDYEARRQAMHAPRDVPPELASCYEYPLLSREQEAHLFRKMNYLKAKAVKLRAQLRTDGALDAARVKTAVLEEIEALQAQANLIKDHLINANMRLVVNIAKRHAGQTDNFFELLSDGNMSLIRAVEKFDASRGFKFSTYASWAIMKNFARTIPDEKHRRERFVTGHEEVFEIAPDNRTDEHEIVASKERASQSINKLLDKLEPREREIIRMRAGLDSHAKGMTLEEIGQQFGITKERVRQLNARAMKKLRSMAEHEDIDNL
ncbi:MAG: sigma-70 family RNA polymerase sigma factor [Gemmataceae bacterium]|nr:sigma-70 family RNA polymerase sigma factor [Gemmataceae bacterium]